MSLLYSVLVGIFNVLAPKLSDKLIEYLLSGKEVFIDRVNNSTKNNSFIFDITCSSSIDQEVSITQFNASLNMEGNLLGINAIKEISSKYLVSGQQGEVVAEVNQTIYSNQVKAWKSGNGIHFRLPVLENQHGKSTNRFTVEWITDEDLTKYKKVSVKLGYAIFGKKKTTKKYELENPLWVDNDDSTKKHVIYGSSH